MRKRKLSDAECAERRRRDRERLEQATAELVSSDGWRRWVQARSTLHGYSLHNTVLIASQCYERGIEPSYMAGFRAWLKLNRCVRKGEKAIRILAPMTVKERDADGEETDERRVVFRTVSVFALEQTEPLPDTEPIPLELPAEPITGDSHAHLLGPLEALAAELGYQVSYEPLSGGAGGFCDGGAGRIVVHSQAPANRRVAVLVHEVAHGVGYRDLGRQLAEVVVESVAYVVCAGAGLDVSGEAVPYIARWGGDEPLEQARRASTRVDELARRIEDAIAAAGGS